MTFAGVASRDVSSPLPPRRQHLPPLPPRLPDDPAAAPVAPVPPSATPAPQRDTRTPQAAAPVAPPPAVAPATGDGDDGVADVARRGIGVRVADRRGLTATGAVALGLGLGAAGGLYDVLTGPGLRTVFAVCFVVGSALAAATVHREDLRAAVVMPPLVYVTLAFIGGTIERAADPGSFVTQQALELANALFVGAPVLAVAALLALLVAGFRALRGRRRDRGTP